VNRLWSFQCIYSSHGSSFFRSRRPVLLVCSTELAVRFNQVFQPSISCGHHELDVRKQEKQLSRSAIIVLFLLCSEVSVPFSYTSFDLKPATPITHSHQNMLKYFTRVDAVKLLRSERHAAQGKKWFVECFDKSLFLVTAVASCTWNLPIWKFSVLEEFRRACTWWDDAVWSFNTDLMYGIVCIVHPFRFFNPSQSSIQVVSTSPCFSRGYRDVSFCSSSFSECVRCFFRLYGDSFVVYPRFHPEAPLVWSSKTKDDRFSLMRSFFLS
jgi:hypothetical protein